MKVAYHAASVIDAQLVVDLLAAGDIPAHVQGSFLSGGAGELPLGELVRVWVPAEHFDAAQQLLAERWHQAAPLPAMEPLLERSWQRAWAAIGARGDGAAMFERLVAAWSEPRRRYHSLQHLEECLALFEEHAALAARPGEVELALWFHDAVYEVRGKDNELRSAELAVEALRAAQVDAEPVERVRRLVMATCHEALPETPDEALLVDIDLSILGAPGERFDEYEVQVRQEYSWVPRALFRIKRREVLAGFLARDSIYSTAALRAEREQQARANLARSLAKLQPWYQFWKN